MERTPQRGRPLTASGHVDRVSEQLVEARGHLVLAMDHFSDAVRALTAADRHNRGLRDVVDGRAAA